MKSHLSPVEHSYRELMRLIADGEFRPGERLPALALAKRFGVSRTPVIQVLKRMEAEGIVFFTPGSGARLIDPTAKEIRDTYVVRAHLEGLALRFGFDSIDAPTTIRLEKHVEMEKAYFQRGDKVNCLQAGLDFHRELARTCRNDRLIYCLESTLKATFVYLMLLEPKDHSLASVHPAEHARLLEIIASGDSEMAVSFLIRHIEESCSINIPNLQFHPSPRRIHPNPLHKIKTASGI